MGFSGIGRANGVGRSFRGAGKGERASIDGMKDGRGW